MRLLQNVRVQLNRATETRRRPYRVECTGSLSTSEVKQHRARLVLGWGTAWEDLWVLSASSLHHVSKVRRVVFLLALPSEDLLLRACLLKRVVCTWRVPARARRLDVRCRIRSREAATSNAFLHCTPSTDEFLVREATRYMHYQI